MFSNETLKLDISIFSFYVRLIYSPGPIHPLAQNRKKKLQRAAIKQ